MLESLHIKNYALIESLDINFHKGFSIITGETGAGKSIILGALGMLLGERADAKSIKPGASHCIIEAIFDLSVFEITNFFSENGLDFDGKECIIRRELSNSGKSRAFINDTPVSVGALRDLGSQLVDIHSQHQNLLLNEKKFQLNILDTVAGNQDLAARYRSIFITFQETARKLELFEENLKQKQDNNDYVAFQLKELEGAKLNSGEQQELEEEAQMLNNAGEIKDCIFRAKNLLSDEETGITKKISECARILQNLSNIYPKITQLSERLDSCAIELEDIEQELSEHCENITFDPERQTFVNERLDILNSLENKFHKKSVEELITLTKDLQNEIELLADSSSILEKLLTEKKELEKEANSLAQQLSTTRLNVIGKVEEYIQERLRSLGIPNIRFVIHLEKEQKPSLNGIDNVTFLFSANKDMPLQDIATVGSGGEIARVMLSLKALLSRNKQMRTLIFDEIDTGVSGRIAEKMALMMKEISNNGNQVISITHLPQIAAIGEHHYLVYKEDFNGKTTTKIRLLSPEERVTEIAHMLSGATLTKAAVSNAKALLNQQ